MTTIEESRAKSPENNMHHVETQQVATQQSSPHPSSCQKDSPMPIDIPVIVNKPIIDSPEQKIKNKQSWFTGLLHDLKKSTSSKTTKKAGLAAFFSSNKSANSSSLIQKSSSSSSTSTKSTSTKSTKSNSNSSNTSNAKTLRKKKRLPASLARKVPRVPSAPLISRYPLDTERAIYRLSHVKLSNSKRPLQQQVVISNMMYWYLSVTEKQQQQQQKFMQQQQFMHQQQQQQYNNNLYYANSRQQVYFDNVYQATYHSFEPPAPGGSDYYNKKQAINHVYQQRPVDPYVPSNNLTENRDSKVNNKKDKYKPVRNTQYEPIMASNNR